MALKLAGEETGIQENIESLLYGPGLKDSGDMETGTHTIVPTSRPATPSAQYSKVLTLPKPSDARMVVKRICARLSVNIAGLGTATHVYLSVRVDVDDTDHELMSEDWTSTGAKLDAVDLHSGAKATIFDLLRDGLSHTFYFLFWADAGNQVTLDVVQLWEGIGSCATQGGPVCVEISHKGLTSIGTYIQKVGTGTAYQSVYATSLSAMGTRLRVLTSDVELSLADNTALVDIPNLCIRGTVTTDLNYLERTLVLLRSLR